MHLLLAIPQIRSWMLRVLADVDVQFFLLFEFFANNKIPLLDNKLDRQTIFLHDNFFIVHNLLILFILRYRCGIIICDRLVIADSVIVVVPRRYFCCSSD